MPFLLRYGIDELRILGSFILVIVMAVLVYAAVAVGILVISVIVGLVSPAVAGLAAGIATIVSVGGLIWFLTRISLAFPASLDSGTIGIARSWDVTAGSAGKLFLFWCLMMGAAMIAVMAYTAVVMPDYVGLMVELTQSSGEAQVSADVERRMFEMQQAIWDPSSPGYWPRAVFNFAITAIWTAVWYGASGIAYRYLSADDGRIAA